MFGSNLEFMDINMAPETQRTGETPLSKEHIGHPVPVNFFKLGGTWDMIERDGRRVGTGKLDDDELKRLQTEAGLFNADNRQTRTQVNRQIAIEVYQRFQETQPEPDNTAEHLSSWAVNKKGESFGDFADGPFTALFSGDSSHLRNPLIAPMTVALIDAAKKEPTKPILGGQGTDTADIALLCMYDAYTYDTQLPPLVLTGANDPHSVPNSDAPDNFIDTAKIIHKELGSGAYWIFHGYLFSASDLVKLNPEETRMIEEQGTFWAAHKTSLPVSTLLKVASDADWQKRVAPTEDHIVNKLTMGNLYDAYESIYVIDLGNQNPGWSDMERIFDPEVKVIIVAAHSLGNVDNETRIDLVRAARMGKLVVDVSRSLVGATNESYEASLLGANQDLQELGGTGRRIIAAHKLNKSLARALTSRALLEGLDQEGTQKLFDHYASSREMV